ncbi:MAG: hypothetical protein JOZ29_12865 [Deltaproteobacteria bacterium]|nr:hypothetical protein [Deltaproteobacteria bacterium]
MSLSFAFWFAISMTLAQVSLSAAQTASTYSGSGSYSGRSSDPHFDTSGYTPEQSESQALTEYLKQRKLPLVGAQVLRGADGRRMVVLYGFVGSDFGKADAVKKTRLFLRDSTVNVDNRINVRSELLVSNRPSRAAGSNPVSEYPPAAGSASNSERSPTPDGSSAYPGPESYKAQQASPYAQQLNSMMPLIALLGALGMRMAGGSSGFSFGSSQFGSPMYGNPHCSPNGPYGSPYGGFPFGGSPYSRPPYGSSPYGNYPYGSSPYGYTPYGSAPYP